jgi:hypothetical protein
LISAAPAWPLPAKVTARTAINHPPTLMASSSGFAFLASPAR